jgi:uncharacterized membrane protein YedE/YeeE
LDRFECFSLLLVFSLSSGDQIGVALGTVFGAFLSQRLSGVVLVQDNTLSAFRQFFGGFLVLFGARMAGGCASGHGLSGIARLSSASIITAAAMFAGKVLLRVVSEL